MRLADEVQFSVYNFEYADVEKAWKHFDLCESECAALLEKYSALSKQKTDGAGRDKQRFPLLGAYDLCLKCSHLFNILDSRGAISVTERVGVIARVRALAVGIARAWVDQQQGNRRSKKKKKRSQRKSRRRRWKLCPRTYSNCHPERRGQLRRAKLSRSRRTPTAGKLPTSRDFFNSARDYSQIEANARFSARDRLRRNPSADD